MNHRIIQWNCHRIKANRNKLLLSLTGLLSAIIRLQETFHKANDNIKLNDHKTYNYINDTGHMASGGGGLNIN